MINSYKQKSEFIIRKNKSGLRACCGSIGTKEEF